MVYMKDGSDDAGAQAKAFLQSVDETKVRALISSL
jgi:hypothetical protein